MWIASCFDSALMAALTANRLYAILHASLPIWPEREEPYGVQICGYCNATVIFNGCCR